MKKLTHYMVIVKENGNTFHSFNKKGEVNMELSKATRDYVRDGTLLRSKYESYMVTGIWDQGKGKCITVQIMEVSDPNHKCWIGHRVYGRPMSEYYGLEIINYGIEEGR